MNPAQPNAFVFTPNASLAQQLRRQRLLLLGRRSAPAASIQVLQNWLINSVQPERVLATDNQLRLIWEQVIAEQRDHHQDLQQLNPGYLAGQALSAWRSLKRFQIDPDELAKAETGQLLSFKKWVIEFEKRLSAQQLSTLDLELEKGLRKQPAPLGRRPPLAQLYAFMEAPPPLWMNWLSRQFDCIETCEFGAQTDPENFAPKKPELEKTQLLYGADSDDQELMAALHWAKSLLPIVDKPIEEDAGNRMARTQIAIIDIQLNDRLKRVKRIAGNLLKGLQLGFSREQSLASEGPVQIALKLLSLNERQIDLASARLIVQSPLWGAAQIEYSLRTDWDRRLCAMQCAQIKTSDFIRLLTESGVDNGVSELINNALSARHRTKPMSTLDWCDHFQSQLVHLKCIEHFTSGQSQRWIEALADFAKLGSVAGNLSISDALRLLRQCCSAAYAKSSSSASAVTFLDTIEAAADCSHVWILAMDNNRWPGSPSLNPLLPVSLQIQKQMPHSQPQMEAELAKRLIERLQQSAQQVVFSYSRFDGDLEQSPCAFIAQLPEFIAQPPEFGIDLEQTYAEQMQPSSTAMQWVDCASAPTVPEAQREVRSGAGLLKTMAVSPFDAFVQWRLGAYELEEPKIGLSALDRGNLVHNILECLWRELGNSQALSELDSAATENLCKTFAEKELSRFQSRHGWLQQGFVELEVERLSTLAKDWLDVERERPEFTVELTEQGLSANIAGLIFNMRLDRLDRLSDGKLLLIDYKTGNSLSRKYWLDMPPAEPQLPLYALTLNDAPDAICFAKVRSDKMEFIGIGNMATDAAASIRGIHIEENWHDLFDNWKNALEQLAMAYINGDTRAFKTDAGFGRVDALAPIHRFAEFEQLQLHSAKWQSTTTL